MLEKIKEEITMLRGSLQTIQKVRTTVLRKSESMFEILNTNIDRGKFRFERREQ